MENAKVYSSRFVGLPPSVLADQEKLRQIEQEMAEKYAESRAREAAMMSPGALLPRLEAMEARIKILEDLIFAKK